MATQAGVAYVTVAYDPVGVKKLRAETAAQGQQLAKSWSTTAKGVGSSMRGVGASMSKYVTLPIVAAGAVAIKFATDFDSSLTKIQALVGANAQQMDLYRKSILALAPAVGIGPKELADSLYFITSSGFKGAEALKVLKASAQGAAAGLGSTQDVANIATSAVTAYGAANITASQAVDVLTATVREGKGDPAELADALGQNIGVAQQLGISFDQVGAAMSALTLVSPNVAEDATQLSGVMSGLLKPTAQAQAEFKKLGFSAQGLRDSVKNKGLLPTLLELKAATKGNQDALGKLFPNIRALRGFLALTGQAAGRNVGIFKRLADSTGDTADALKKAGGTESFKFKQALAELQVAAINAGEALIPIAVQIANGVKTLADAFNRLGPTGQRVVLIIAGIAAVIGPVVFTIGAMVTVVTVLTGAFTALAVATGLALLPFTVIVVAVAALAVGFVIAYKKSSTFRAIVQANIHALVDGFHVLVAVIQAVANHFGPVRAIATAALQAIAGFVRLNIAYARLFANVVSAIAGRFGFVKKAGVAAFGAIKAAISGVVGLAQSVYGAIQSIVGALQSLYDTAKSVISLGGSGSGPVNISAGRGAGAHPPGRAIGGPVTAGQTYVVGEVGPEVFTPSVSGHITPNNQLGGATMVQVYIGDEQLHPRLVRVVQDENRKTSRRVRAGSKWGN